MDKLHINTKAVRAAQPKHEDIRPVAMPIYLSTTYERQDDGNYSSGYVYARNANPNRSVLEEAMAQLEGGEVAFAFSSGMAAIAAVMQSLSAGDHILLPDDVYFKLLSLLQDVMERWELTYTLVDMTDVAAIKAALRANTKLVWLETPSNPMLKITDIAAVAEAVGDQCLLAVDNTWATPVLLNPLELGADVVVHSTTKYINGHSDVLGGVVVCKEEGVLSHKISQVQVAMGAVPSAFDSWLISRGIQTLPLRVKAQSQSAMSIARHLSTHPAVSKVHYPGLAAHIGHRIAAEQMKGLYGAMLSIEVAGDEARSRQVCNSLQLFTQATSLGGVESLVEHRRSVEGPTSNTPSTLLRLSIGLEHAEDLIQDLDQALNMEA